VAPIQSETRLEHEYAIGPAQPSSVGPLPEVEVRAAAIFSPEDIPLHLRSEGLAAEFFERAAREGRLWTAVHRSSQVSVGFALATIVDGSAHLLEMDVLPEHARRGLGRALAGEVATWARAQGFPTVTLTTFRHLPWNAPFYRRLGFVEISDSDLSPELAQHLAREAEHGLDPTQRTAMRLTLEG